MIRKKLLSLYLIQKLTKGPDIVLGLLLLIFFCPSVEAMCKFPHNPAVLCISGDINNAKIVGNKCKLEVKVLKALRPKNVYSYDNDLKRIDHTEATSYRTEDNVTIYTDTNDCLRMMNQVKSVALAAKMNCSDEDAALADFSLVKIDLKGQVQDPWTKDSVMIDCSFLKR